MYIFLLRTFFSYSCETIEKINCYYDKPFIRIVLSVRGGRIMQIDMKETNAEKIAEVKKHVAAIAKKTNEYNAGQTHSKTELTAEDIFEF